MVLWSRKAQLVQFQLEAQLLQLLHQDLPVVLLVLYFQSLLPDYLPLLYLPLVLYFQLHLQGLRCLLYLPLVQLLQLIQVDQLLQLDPLVRNLPEVQYLQTVLELPWHPNHPTTQ